MEVTLHRFAIIFAIAPCAIEFFILKCCSNGAMEPL